MADVPFMEIDFPLLLDLGATIRRLEDEGFSERVVAGVMHKHTLQRRCGGRPTP